MTLWTRSDSPPAGFLNSIAPRWIALGLFLLTLALRLPFASRMLNHWDSVNHALALTSFYVPAHRPQPPGYILYIGFARLVNLVVPDAQTALVLVSILASSLAVAFLFLLGTRMASRELGLVAALLLLTSPPFWFDGEVALPYAVEGGAAVMLAYLLYRVRHGEAHLGPLAAVVFAIAVGMRQQLALFFAPLALYAYWNTSWRTRIEAVAWFGFVCLLWFVPLILSAGGIEPYFTALSALNSAFRNEYVLFGAGGLNALARNVERIGAYALYALNLAILPILWAAFQTVRRPSVLNDARVRFLALWIIPAFVFYVFFHMGSPGLIYVFLPALYLIAAFGLVDLTRARPSWLYVATGALLVVNVFIFMGTPPDLYMGRESRVLNYAALREHDATLSARVDGIRANFDPATTLVVADDWRFAEYYLPNFRVLYLPPDLNSPAILSQGQQETYMRSARVDVSNVEMIVWFDETSPRTFRGTLPECMQMQSGGCLPVLHLAERGGIRIKDNAIEESARE